jgi:hypothetical protein
MTEGQGRNRKTELGYVGYRDRTAMTVMPGHDISYNGQPGQVSVDRTERMGCQAGHDSKGRTVGKGELGTKAM